MTEPEKGSAKSFRYNSALENNIGKRTGHYIRRSGIGKDWDGLENLNDYFDTNTDRHSVANTDELESSLTSDVFIEDSDTEDKRLSVGSSGRSKRDKKKEQRKKKMLQLSGRKSFGLFEDLLEPSQTQTQNVYNTRSSRKSNFEDSLAIKAFSSKIKGKGRNREDSSKDVSPGEARDTYPSNDMTMMTHLTKTPSVSKSLIYEDDSAQTAQKELNSLIKQHNEQFSEYLHNLQEDKKLKSMRTQLKQIQDSRSQEFSLFQSPGALSGIMPSPQTRDMNFTTFSILDSTNKKQKEHNKEANRDKELKGFRQPDLKESPQEKYKQENKAGRKGKENEEVDTKQGKKPKEEQKEKTKKNEDKKQGKKGKEKDEEEEETKVNTEANRKDTKKEDTGKENKQETKKNTKQISPKIEESEKARNKKSEESSLNIKPLGRSKEETKTRTSKTEIEEEEVYQRGNTDRFEYRESVHYEDNNYQDNYQDDGGYGGYDQEAEDNYSRASSDRISPEKKEKKVVQSKKGTKKEKNANKDDEDIEQKTKRVKQNQTKEPTGKVKIPKLDVIKKKEPEEKKKMKIEVAKHTKKRKRDKFLEAYDKAIGPNDLHLVQKPIEKTREFFANGRYPKRHRVGMSCFWKNERSIYMNTGDGIEIVGIMREEFSPEDVPKRSKSKAVVKKKIEKPTKKEAKSPEDLKGKSKNIREDSDNEQEFEALDKMELDYKVISEDAHAITVFLKLKPKQIKEPQTNIAGVMQCSVIKCEDRKAEVFCGQKQYVLSLNDKFVIPEKGIYSIHNKSKTKDLEISCNILKGK